MGIYDFNEHFQPVASPLEQQRKFLALQNLGQQNTLNDQRITAGQQENQMRQSDIDSQKAIMKAYTEANGDLNQTLPLAAKYGAKPDALLKLKAVGMEQQKQNLELLKSKGARALQEADVMQGAHDAVAAAPPEQRQQLYQQQLMGLQQFGIDTSKMPPQYPGDQAFQLIGASVKGHKQQLDDLAKGLAIQKAQAELPGAVAQTAKEQFEAMMKQRQLAGTSPTGVTAVQQLEDARSRRGQDITVRGQNMTDARAKEANRIAELKRSEKPPTEGERNAFSFYQRATDADKILTDLEPKIAGLGLAGQVGRAVLPNAMQSDDSQIYTQAQRQFTQAKLRRESGAAISQSEYDQDAKTYFPVPGDSKVVLQRKAAARKAVMRELRVASGRAYTDTYGDEQPAKPTADPLGIF